MSAAAPWLGIFGHADDACLASSRDQLASRDDTELLPLSTCERHELLVYAHGPVETPDASSLIAEQADAAERLFTIAAGLHSVVPGEDAIATQLAAALRTAMRCGQAGPTLGRLVARALRAADAIRAKVREETPLHQLADLVVRTVTEDFGTAPAIGLLGAGPVAAAVRRGLDKAGCAVALHGTRRPTAHRVRLTSLDEVLSRLDTLDVVITALRDRPALIDADDHPSTTMIDLAAPGNVRRAAWTPETLVRRHANVLARQRDALQRAAHRLPALAAAALAESVAPSITDVSRSIARFRESIVDAELARLAPVLDAMGDDEAERIRRSIRHTAARAAHPMHEYVNQLGRQGRADDATTFVDHLLGSRVGWSSLAADEEAGNTVSTSPPHRPG